jgi:hypothetical protein
MYADQQSQREAAILAAQMGMGRPQAQQVPQYMPAQQSPSINFNPTIITGGQPGVIGGGAGGAGSPGAGGALGGGGIVPPGFMGGPGGGTGGGPTPPGGGGGTPTPGPAGKPQKFETVLAGLRGQFPLLKTNILEGAAQQIANNPNVGTSQKASLKQMHDGLMKEKQKIGEAFKDVEFIKGVPSTAKYALNGQEYKGPITVFSDGSAVPYDRQEVIRRRKAGLKMQPLTKLSAATREPTMRERREQQSAARTRSVN